MFSAVPAGLANAPGNLPSHKWLGYCRLLGFATNQSSTLKALNHFAIYLIKPRCRQGARGPLVRGQNSKFAVFNSQPQTGHHRFPPEAGEVA